MNFIIENKEDFHPVTKHNLFISINLMIWKSNINARDYIEKINDNILLTLYFIVCKRNNKKNLTWINYKKLCLNVIYREIYDNPINISINTMKEILLNAKESDLNLIIEILKKDQHKSLNNDHDFQLKMSNKFCGEGSIGLYAESNVPFIKLAIKTKK